MKGRVDHAGRNGIHPYVLRRQIAREVKELSSSHDVVFTSGSVGPTHDDLTIEGVAKAFGAKVFATAGNADKCAACEKLGADQAINYRDEDFVEAIGQATGGKGVDVVLDMVGGDYIPRSIKAMAIEGRHVSIAFLRGPKVELNVEPVMRNRLTLTGSTLRPRSVAEKSAIGAELREKVWPLLSSGKIKPVIYKTFLLAEAAQAHALMESSEHIGKIALITRNEVA